MDNPKITKEQFNEYKAKCRAILSELYETVERNKDNPNFNRKEFMEQLKQRHLAIQSELLKFDLSTIPDFEWKGFPILTDKNHPVDLSNTHANIDFRFFKYSHGINFKGCKIKNLNSLNKHLMLKASAFDQKVVDENKEMFLSDSFSQEFQQKLSHIELTIPDLFSLRSEQVAELISKNFIDGFEVTTRELIDLVGLDNLTQLYSISKDDFQKVYELYKSIEDNIFAPNLFRKPDVRELFKNISPTEIKQTFYLLEKQEILSKPFSIINPKDYPESFVKENDDIFMLNVGMSDDLRKRFYERKLTFDDIKDNINVFKNISLSKFIINAKGSKTSLAFESIVKALGDKTTLEAIELFPEHFNYIIKSDLYYEFTKFVEDSEKLELNQSENDKKILMDFLQSFFASQSILASNNKITNTAQLMLYNPSLFPLDEKQNRIIQILGLENIKKFEKETGFFFHKENDDMISSLNGLSLFEKYFDEKIGSLNNLVDFKDGTLSYEEFVDEMAKCLDAMRIEGLFSFNGYPYNAFPNYDWIQGEFRENHPEIFMDLNAPEELKKVFYKNVLDPKFLYEHKDYVKYLVDKNVLNMINANIQLAVPGEVDEQGRLLPNYSNFIDEYVSRYGNEKFLQLCAKYGEILSDITITSLHDEIENEQAIEHSLRNAIYNKILKDNKSSTPWDYSYLASVSEFVTEHPEIFVNFDNLTNISKEERRELKNKFYSRNLSFDDIKKYPELVTVLKDKNLSIAFDEKADSDLELLQVFGNEKFLQLCAKFGRYMDGIAKYLSKVDWNFEDGFGFGDSLSFEENSKRIESIVIRESKLGNIAYRPEDAPDFLKENCPELFLESDAPDELEKYFYNYDNNYPMSFKVLQKHKEWLPFLKDKALITSLLKGEWFDELFENKEELIKYFELFGEEKGGELGANRWETIDKMIESSQVELMRSWYDKTGGKFIPDFVVMQNFKLEEADKFLISGSIWSKLMRIKNFSEIPESREAMLKLAYSFGAFDQDQRGFKKLQDLLTSLPKKIDADNGYIIEQIDRQIDKISQRDVFYHNIEVMDVNGDKKIESLNMTLEEKEEAYNKMLEYTKKSNFIDFIDTPTLVNLFETLKKEKVDIDISKPIFAQIYRENEDGTRSLIINSQSCPKSSQIIRGVLEKFRRLPILTPEKAYQLFGGFELKYDADFREFLLDNMNNIMKNSEYVSFIASIQKQFSEIKAINSNRALTLNLAVSYVQSNKYTSINVGNERVAEESAIAGYNQEDFETLQQIYNYGKQRTFSSIPRIEAKVEKISGRYTYEILRLDDPLAMTVGTLTSCCQKLNDSAEVCMEHSMVDKNGRVFVIRNEEGNIVAQSWVWRNKDVLCFDNIEIPNKVINMAFKKNPEFGRKGFPDEIFQIYKQAAHDLIQADDVEYKKLLEDGKITQEQYEGLRLGKVTVGLGYNDIAKSIEQNSVVDNEFTSPLSFKEPVKLSRGLYTSDSETQYRLEQREDRKAYNGKTLPIHADSYIEYDDNSFKEKNLLSLEKLELITKPNVTYLDTQLSEHYDKEHIVSQLAHNYELNPKTTRIILHPNFAIIYDINGDRVKIGDLLYNTVIDNNQQQMNIEDKVIIQLRLALEQIAQNKQIDISSLNASQTAMYSKAVSLNEELDYERGVGRAR